MHRDKLIASVYPDTKQLFAHLTFNVCQVGKIVHRSSAAISTAGIPLCPILSILSEFRTYWNSDRRRRVTHFGYGCMIYKYILSFLFSMYNSVFL